MTECISPTDEYSKCRKVAVGEALCYGVKLTAGPFAVLFYGAHRTELYLVHAVYYKLSFVSADQPFYRCAIMK